MCTSTGLSLRPKGTGLMTSFEPIKKGSVGKRKMIRIYLIGVLCGVMITAAVAFGFAIPANSDHWRWEIWNRGGAVWTYDKNGHRSGLRAAIIGTLRSLPHFPKNNNAQPFSSQGRLIRSLPLTQPPACPSMSRPPGSLHSLNSESFRELRSIQPSQPLRWSGLAPANETDSQQKQKRAAGFSSGALN